MTENGGSNLADDIFGSLAYEAPLPTRKEFLPWHRPRKQFVRESQWLDQIGRLLDDFKAERQTLRYLGLPGVDLLDLRFFHDNLCEQRGLKLRFLGFNNAAHPASAAQIELNISLDEVRRLAGVDPASEVIRDDVRGIANSSSIAWKRTLDLGPYDVINLDLCDGFGVDEPGDTGSPTYFDALNKLISLQARSPTPWLLLLTTRAGENHIHGEVLKAFVAKYASNLAECPTFKTASLDLFHFDEVSTDEPTGGRHLPLFLSGLCKWMLNAALSLKPPSSVEVKSVVGYRIDHNSPHEDLISIAVRFSPTFTPVIDGMGLAQYTSAELDECELAVKAIRRIAKIVNADDILLGNVDLHAAMVDATAILLSVARYDPDAYRQWVTTQNVSAP